MPTKDQVTGILERLVAAVLLIAVTRGMITESDATQWAPALVIVLSAAYGWWINRPKAIAQSAASLPLTTVLTSADLAAATPGQSNIISIDSFKVVQW